MSKSFIEHMKKKPSKDTFIYVRVSVGTKEQLIALQKKYQLKNLSTVIRNVIEWSLEEVYNGKRGF